MGWVGSFWYLNNRPDTCVTYDHSNATVFFVRSHGSNIVTGLRPAELDERLERGDRPFLLDIRPRENYQSSSIDGSHNLPVYHDLAGGDDASLRERLDEIPREREVVVVCKMGFVAKKATRLLDDEGYDAATLAGGMSGWNGYRNDTLLYKLRSILWRIF